MTDSTHNSMPERPTPTSLGTIRRTLEPQRLFEAEMPNGFLTLAVVRKSSPPPPPRPEGRQVELAFSPFDMAQCKVIRWL